MKTFGERLHDIRLERGIAQNVFAEIIGEKSGKVVWNWENGLGKPDVEKIVKICAVLQVSADELLGIEREKDDVLPNELGMIKKYRELDTRGKKNIEMLLDSEYSACRPKTPVKILTMQMRKYTIPASAGTGSYIDSDDFETVTVPVTPEAKEADFMITVSGDSMEPTFHDGENVYVKKQETVGIGDIGIFYLNGETYIKELGKGCLISHNKVYKPIAFGNEDSFLCYGKVVGLSNRVLC